ncbi:MAG TPA: hypothetical protein VEC06_11550 [Paucimonas sp.]|nr:hypothetical protein [Paucimonas sp.]
MKNIRMLVCLFALGTGHVVCSFAQERIAGNANFRKTAGQAAPNNVALPPRTSIVNARSADNHDGSRPHHDVVLTEWFRQSSYPRPISEWLSNEKRTYEKIVARKQFDILIVPFQVQDHAFDRATRSLMTAMLSQAVAVAGKLSLPDSYFVARALGDGQRRLKDEDVYRLADAANVKQIIWSYAGHDRHDKMALTIRIQSRDENGVLNDSTVATVRNFVGIEFSDEDPVIDQFSELIPSILRELGLDGPILKPVKPGSVFDTPKLPASPKELISDSKNPVKDAFFYQVLAALTPQLSERTKEKFAEKSLLSVQRISPDDPRYRLLKARAFMMLNMRPAALKVLRDGPASLEERALIAALNGNLPDMRKFLTELPAGIPKLLARIDENVIATNYRSIDQKQIAALSKKVSVPGNIWPYFVERALLDTFVWHQQGNFYLKNLLEREFPIETAAINGRRDTGKATQIANATQTTGDLLIFKQLMQLSNAEFNQSSLEMKGVSVLDYLDFIEAIATDNLMRRAHFYSNVQGNPQEALRLLNAIEPIFRDHPRFSFERAKAKARLAGKLGESEGERLSKEAYADALNAVYWEQGQSQIASRALTLSLDLEREDFGYFPNPFVGDHPYHSYYSTWTVTGASKYRSPYAEKALRNSTSEIWPAEELFGWLSKDKADELLRSLRGRFEGSAEYVRLLAAQSTRKGDFASTEQLYRKLIKLQPADWRARIDLSKLLLEKGKIGESFALVRGYAGFAKGSTENPVGIANNAAEAAALFYWTGNFDEAKALYQICVAQRTGADSELRAWQRLQLIQGDIKGAAHSAATRIRRYAAPNGYADYLAMLYAAGSAAEAQKLSDYLSSQGKKSFIWEGALVGQRMAGADEGTILSWIKQGNSTKSGQSSENAATFLIRAGLIDRYPTATLRDAMEDIEIPVSRLEVNERNVVRESGGKNMPVLGPNTSRFGAVLPGQFVRESRRTRVKSDHVYFIEALQKMKEKDYASARLLLSEALNLYDVSVDETGYLLPYLAFAGARSGAAEEVKGVLARFEPERYGFQYYLARSILEGLSGNHGAAMALAQRAKVRGTTWNSAGLQSGYIYAEILDWLYQATKEERYRGEALDWAKKNQIMHPWMSWPYAVEVGLQDKPALRRRAVGMTHYLDPNSERLKSISKQEIAEAVRGASSTNPFLQQNRSEEAGKQVP